MENLLRKSAIYGFFIGIGLAILFVKHKVVENFDGGYSTYEVPIMDYVITVLKCGVVASIIGLLSGLILFYKKKN